MVAPAPSSSAAVSLGLLGVEQGLAHQQVRAAVDEAPDLAAVVLHQQVKVVRIPAVAEGGQGGNVACDQAARGGGTAQSDELGIDGLGVVFQADFPEGNGLGLEGGGIDDFGARLGIAPLELHQDLGVAQNPFLRGAVPGHSLGAQVRAGGPVQQARPLGQQFGKIILCQHKDFTSVFR